MLLLPLRLSLTFVAKLLSEIRFRLLWIKYSFCTESGKAASLR